MTFQNPILATQRHDMDVEASNHRMPIARRRTSVSTRLGHVLLEAGSRLVTDRRSFGRIR